ncbi:MAG: protein kinase [bacterium]
MSFPSFESFKIEKKVSQGLCYTLYRAIDQRDGNSVFLKVLARDLAQDEETVANFINGARIARMVNHPNIAKVYGYGEEQSKHYISSEITELEPLKTLILDTFSLSLEDLTKIFTTIARTLSFAHLHGVAHGLLSPQNIYVNSSSEIRIDDLGFSWYIPNLLKGRKKDSLYLAQYIAPEYFLDPEKADGRSDIYSLGVILFEFLNGQNPFAADDIESIRQLHLRSSIPTLDFTELQLPPEFGQLLNKTLSRIPERRFQNLSAFAQAFQGLAIESTESPEASAETFPTIFKPPSVGRQVQAENADERISPRSWYMGLGKFAFSGLGIIAIIFVIFLLTTDFLNSPAVNDAGDFASLSPVISLSDSSNDGDEQLSSITSDVTSRDSSFPAEDEDLSVMEVDGLAQSRTLSEPDQASKPHTAPVDFIVTADNNPVTQARIFLDEQLIGATDENGRLTVDRLEINRAYAVRVSKDGYAVVSRSITPSRDNASISVDLRKKVDSLGTLIVNAIPNADSVFINGIHYDYKLPIETKLRSNTYEVRLVNSDLKQSWRQSVTIKPGQVARVNHDFSVVELGRVAISLENAFEVGFGYLYVDGELWSDGNNTTPIEISLPVGSHTISVARDGYFCVPQDTTITVKKGTPLYLSFHLSKQQ